MKKFNPLLVKKMRGTKDKLTILGTSLLITVVIFAIGLLLNYSFDFFRINAVLDVMREHEIGAEAYLVQQEFVSQFGGNKCRVMEGSIHNLQEEIRKVGTELSTYGQLSFFKTRDFDYLKRKYFLLEVQFLTQLNSLSTDCGSQFIPILFFYEIDNDLSERQGFILSEVGKVYENQVAVLSLDKDYEDEPLVRFLLQRYNVTKAPTIIIGDEIHLEGLHYEKELDGIIGELVRGTYTEEQDTVPLTSAVLPLAPPFFNSG